MPAPPLPPALRMKLTLSLAEHRLARLRATVKRLRRRIKKGAVMATRYCVGLSVSGALRSGEWKTSLVGNVRHNGKALTADEIFDFLTDRLREGHEIIPFGPPCDRWDWKKGCQGHPVNEEGVLTP